MTIDTHVTFKSERFRPVLPDECQVNPGVYGAELAFWLCGELARSGVITSYPDYEDWGWFLEYETAERAEYWRCCGNVDGSDDEWLCFLDPKGQGPFGSRQAPLEGALPLLQALAQVLAAEPSISAIEWSAKAP